MHIGNEENVQMIMKHPTHCAGSDAILHGKSTHPRVSLSFFFRSALRFPICSLARQLALPSAAERHYMLRLPHVELDTIPSPIYTRLDSTFPQSRFTPILY